MFSSRPALQQPILRMARRTLRAPLLVVTVLRSLWFYLLLLWLGLTSLTWNLVSVVLMRLLSRHRGQAIGRTAIARIYRWFWAAAAAGGLMRIDCAALDVLNEECGGLVIAANHPSMLDALLIVARLQRGVCIMKASLMRNVFLGTGARLARYIANDSPRRMVRRAVGCLREGAQLVVFPEGTRTQGSVLNDFRPGFTLIAHRAGVPIQTVIIETDSPYLRKGWAVWRLPPFPVTFTLRLGERFEAGPDHAVTMARLKGYFEKELGP
jgi:1-acyl-sn-glycerol-3-phosphate acyltransferase